MSDPLVPPKWLLDSYIEHIQEEMAVWKSYQVTRPRVDLNRRQRLARKWEYYRQTWLHDKLFPRCDPW